MQRREKLADLRAGLIQMEADLSSMAADANVAGDGKEEPSGQQGPLLGGLSWLFPDKPELSTALEVVVRFAVIAKSSSIADKPTAVDKEGDTGMGNDNQVAHSHPTVTPCP